MIHALDRFPGRDIVTRKALRRPDRDVSCGLLAAVAAQAVADLRADVVHLFERLPGGGVVAG